MDWAGGPEGEVVGLRDRDIIAMVLAKIFGYELTMNRWMAICARESAIVGLLACLETRHSHEGVLQIPIGRIRDGVFVQE